MHPHNLPLCAMVADPGTKEVCIELKQGRRTVSDFQPE